MKLMILTSNVILHDSCGRALLDVDLRPLAW